MPRHGAKGQIPHDPTSIITAHPVPGFSSIPETLIWYRNLNIAAVDVPDDSLMSLAALELRAFGMWDASVSASQ